MTRPDKRQAILTGSRRVFARDGYSRANLDAIAAEAGVSTRTIYNHFTDKAALFQAVIQESAEREAGAQIAIIDRHLRKIVDLQTDLVEFGLEWAAPATGEHAEHFALTRQINAETNHIPHSAIQAWLEAGPLKVRRALAERLHHFMQRGLLRNSDPDRTALHLMVLVSALNPPYLGTIPTDEELAEAVTSGVRTFLQGHHP